MAKHRGIFDWITPQEHIPHASNRTGISGLLAHLHTPGYSVSFRARPHKGMPELRISSVYSES